jgi:hypothetical protein
VVIPEKRWIVGVENAIDEEEFDQFDEIPPFVTSMIKAKIPSPNKALYLRNDHHEKVNNFKKPRLQWKVAKWLCKTSSMCKNMTICVKLDFHWIFVWNMINVWKYGHLCEKLTFIGYLCEICSKCDNMAIWCLGSISHALCAVSEALYLASEEKGEAPMKRVSCISGKVRRALWGCVSILLNCTKKEWQQIILHTMLHGPACGMAFWTRARVSFLINMHKKLLIEYYSWDNYLH